MKRAKVLHEERGHELENGMKQIRPFLVAASAILSVLCFPPFKFGPLIFIVFVPLFLAVEDVSPIKAFKLGYFWGTLFYLGLVYYIAWVTPPGMIATVMVLSLIPATGCMIFVRLMQRVPGLAPVFFSAYFIGWQWLLTMSDLNYPWTDTGYALAYFLPLIQAADIGGVYMISLAILTVNAAIYASVSSEFRLKGAGRKYLRYAAALLVAALYGYGAFRLSKAEPAGSGAGLKVGLLQGNVTRDEKWDPGNLAMNFEIYFDLSRRAASEGAELLIWPETATPTYLVQEKRHMEMVRRLVDSLDVPLLTGTPYYEVVGPNEYVYFNSAVLVEPESENYTVYSKVHLVPMSERIPFSGRFKVLKEIRLGQADFSSGEKRTIFDLDGRRFGAVVCFESAFPGYCREFAIAGAQFLVVITNDMWFGRTSLLEQHAMMSVFRAVENRIPVVRAANTGISMAADRWGRILTKSGIFRREYLLAEVSPGDSRSIYGKVGDVIPRWMVGVAVVSLAVAIVGRRRYNGERI